MIEIRFNPDRMELKINGHAGQAEKGQDIVCSAVSILFYTLAQAVTDSKDMLTEEPKINIEDGNGYVSCKPKEEYKATMQRTYWTVLTGFELLTQGYKDYVSFAVI